MSDRPGDDIAATAPGKILVAGEYAVLDGHPAVMMAIAVRARARLVANPPPPSDFLAAAAEVIAETLGEGSQAAHRARQVRVDTSEFSAGDKKLGLGSSAAATVAAIAGALFEKNTRIFRRQNPITICPTHKRAGIPCQVPDCPRVFALAQKAHARAQEKRGAAGSGADIAAATYGGTLIYERAGNSPRVRPWSPPPGLTLVPVWTQKPAATATLVAAVAAARRAATAAVAAALEDIAAAAKALIAAATAPAAIAAIAAGADAAAHLAEVTGAPLMIPAHHEVAALARAHGGAAKPTGAGGGDIALAALPDAGAAAQFRAAAIAAGLPVIAAGIDCGGVALTSCGSTAPGA